MSESITNTADAVAALGALPMPVGPHVPPWPPAPRDFEEKLRQDVARLQGLLAEAVNAKHLADRERDLMRERVSEPFGCKYCGAEKRWHGRRSISGAGVHGWERPSDEQVKARMLARRAARLALGVAHDAGRRDRYAKALYEFVNGAFVWGACDDPASWLEEADAAIVVADAEQSEWRDRVDEVERKYIVDTAELKRRIAELEVDLAAKAEDAAAAVNGWGRARDRVAELEAERHTTNEALDDAVSELRTSYAARARRESHPGRRQAWRMLAQAEESERVAEALISPKASRSADKLRALLAGQREAAAVESAPKCRCGEPDADPYACEADDCTASFSELNPFAGGPVEGHDAKVSRKCGCGWSTSVWHVDDGSAEEELHGHVTREHDGVHPAKSDGA